MESESTQATKIDLRCKRRNLFGISSDKWIQVFFFGNAWVAILILLLIAFFLFKEGSGFFGQNRQSHMLYRKAGLEFVEQIKMTQEDFTAIYRYLNNLRAEQMEALQAQGLEYKEANQQLAGLEDFTFEYYDLSADLSDLSSELTDFVTSQRDQFISNENIREYQRTLKVAGDHDEAAAVEVSEIDFAFIESFLKEQIPVYIEITQRLTNDISTTTADFPNLPIPGQEDKIARFRELNTLFIQTIPTHIDQMKAWNPNEPVRWMASFTAFIFGKDWVTNSFWQDWYGILPLLSGSLLVSGIALIIAVPFGVAAAVYVNQIASPMEQRWIKPSIEFISAIPSVVLGFFGIAVLGETLRQLSQWQWLDFIPFFPISERLNALTAGCLLALMATPTIFTLAEDAINNVPKAYKEASYAIGATRLQTIFHIIIPTALSGIISAILLGFGRVIGETMVVLLCAGNRIEIPAFSDGLGMIVEPVHTMTGIIAQEMGEVERASIHYRALFVLGILLFLISLLVNWLAQKIVHKFKISV